MAVSVSVEQVQSAYVKKATLLEDYNLLKAYFKFDNASVLGIAEKILLDKYNNPYIRKEIHRKVLALQNTTNTPLVIERIKLNATPKEILRDYIEKNFKKIINDRKKKPSRYPIFLRDIIEKVAAIASRTSSC